MDRLRWTRAMEALGTELMSPFRECHNLERTKIGTKLSVVHWVCCSKPWWSAVLIIMTFQWSAKLKPTKSLVKKKKWTSAACGVRVCGRTHRTSLPTGLSYDFIPYPRCNLFWCALWYCLSNMSLLLRDLVCWFQSSPDCMLKIVQAENELHFSLPDLWGLLETTINQSSNKTHFCLGFAKLLFLKALTIQLYCNDMKRITRQLGWLRQ